MLRLVKVLLMWAYASFYGGMVMIGLIAKIYKKGFRKVFHKSKHERPSILDDPTFGIHGYLHLEEVKIHYVASGPEDKPLMLFLHGFPDFWYSWHNQLKEFQKDYRCVAIDLRGYGESDKPPSLEAYKPNCHLSDVKQIITALGYKSCILVAHDWGGVIAWAFGRHFPDMVDKLIIMNAPPAPVFKKILETDKDQFKKSWYIFFFQLPRLPEFFMNLDDLSFFDQYGNKDSDLFVNPIPEEDVKVYKYRFSQPGAWTPPLNYYRAAFQLDQFKYDMEYIIPILLIWGMKDKALSSLIADESEKASPKITVQRIPESGHFVQMDTPDRVNQLMREWLSTEK